MFFNQVARCCKFGRRIPAVDTWCPRYFIAFICVTAGFAIPSIANCDLVIAHREPCLFSITREEFFGMLSSIPLEAIKFLALISNTFMSSALLLNSTMSSTKAKAATVTSSLKLPPLPRTFMWARIRPTLC